MKRALITIFAFIFYSLSTTLLFAATLDIDLSSNKINADESVTISYILNGDAGNAQPDFSPLEDHFHIVASNFGSAINVVNGVTQVQNFWQLSLKPKTSGKLVIPEINFGPIKSEARELIVTETNANRPKAVADKAEFVEATLDVNTPFIQSQVIYTFKLFYRSTLENARLEPPHLKDIVLMSVGKERSYQTTIKGQQYFVFEKQFALFPQKPGKVTIPPMVFHAYTYDMNPDYFNDAFSMASSKPVRLSTQALPLTVANIPETFSGTTWLPAKNITITEKFSDEPDQWELNNPITRTITIDAEGLRADQLPDLKVESVSGMNVYADAPHRNNNITGNNVHGIWEQKITYIPNKTQSLIIPAVKLNWWNTQTNAPAFSELKPIMVQVKASANQTKAPTTFNTANESTPTQADKLPVKSDNKQQMMQSFYFSIWFWIACILFLIWIITIGVFWKRKTNRKAEVSVEADKNLEREQATILSDKAFRDACEAGEPLSAQRFLLAWAKSHWQDPPQNLAKLREQIVDEDFKKALTDLETALYAKQKMVWNGRNLFAAFQQEQKHSRKSGTIDKRHRGKEQDPLPPLNP